MMRMLALFPTHQVGFSDLPKESKGGATVPERACGKHWPI
jgi:hypothetical protein